MVLSVLLPVRTAFAVTMALPASAMPGNLSSLQAGTPPTPCPHHDDPSAAATLPMEGGLAGVDADQAPSHHATHTHPAQTHTSHLLCDVCNVPALQASERLPLRPHAPPVGTPHRSERFASVVLPIGHKPPIAA